MILNAKREDSELIGFDKKAILVVRSLGTFLDYKLKNKGKFSSSSANDTSLWGVTSLDSAWYFREKSDKLNLCVSDLPGKKTF